jgi:hypothetical protein
MDYNMVRLIRKPQAAAPFTAMPGLDGTARDARHIAAFLAC